MRLKKKKTWRAVLFAAGILFLFIILLVEIFIIHQGIFPLFSSQPRSYILSQPGPPTGDILFTGDTFGEYNLHGCEILGSLTRRATLIGKFKDPMYLEFGNFTPEHPRINEVAVPFIAEALQTMGLRVLNCTKYDFINLGETPVDSLPFILVSANLRIHTPRRLSGLVSPCVVIPFILRSKTGNLPVSVGITGITFDFRRMHHGIVQYVVQDPIDSIKKIKTTLEKAELKILLFNAPFYGLKKLLAVSPVRFDLVIASQSLPQHQKTMIRINGVPVAFSDDYGRTLGHVSVIKEPNGFRFQYTPLMIGLGLPENLRINKIVDRIDDALHRRPTENRDEN